MEYCIIVCSGPNLSYHHGKIRMEVKTEVAILVLLVFGLPVVFGDKSACARFTPFGENATCFVPQNPQSCSSFCMEKNISDCYPEMDEPACCEEVSSHGPSSNVAATSTKQYILYIFLDSLPVLILVPLILFFNINLASGPGHSLVFTFQVLVAVFHTVDLLGIHTPNTRPPCGYKPSGYLLAFGPLMFFNDFLFFFWPFQTLTHYALGYVKILIAGVMVVLYLFLATCSQCPVQCCRSCWAKLRRSVRNWRECHLPQRPVFTGVCSVAILMYGSLVEVSFRLLFRCILTHEVCLPSDPRFFHPPACFLCNYTASSQALLWGSEAHFRYYFPAYIFIGVAVLLSLPFFYHPGVPALVSYLTRGRVQLPRLHRVRPIFDLFQGVYKPRMQFFVGLHLLYRVGMWSAVAFSYNNETKLYASICVWVVILAVHSLFQPFESRRHNYLETLLMVNVALLALSFLSFKFTTKSSALGVFHFFVSLSATVFPNLPLFCIVVYYLYKFVRGYCGTVRRCSGYAEMQAQGDEDEMEESYQGERWKPPNDESVF